ncbi:hypothetical protein ES703_111566 [subsurface metagenome]
MEDLKKSSRGEFIKTVAAGMAGAGLVFGRPQLGQARIRSRKNPPGDKIVVGYERLLRTLLWI